MGDYRKGDWVTVVSNHNDDDVYGCHQKSWYTIGKTFQVARNEGKSSVLKDAYWIHCPEHSNAISSNQLRYATPDANRADV